MSHWNYRIVHEGDIQGYGIKEVHYNDEGVPIMYTAKYVYPYGETFNDLEWDLQLMSTALDKPILIYPDDFDQSNAVR